MQPGRPIIKRSAKAFARDLASLKRLRKAIMLDQSFDQGQVRQAVEALDTAIAAIRPLFSVVASSAA